MKKNKLVAVLGPTNTGKTYLAIETMLSFETGMIGFPLRLLAREVYDKVIKKVDPGKQLAQWQDPKKAVAEPAKAEPAKAQPSVATTSTTYGQGSDTDYATAVKGKSAGQTYSAARSTTNPTTTQTGTEDNPDWATWDAKRQSYDTEKQTQKSKDTKSKAAQPLSQIGYGTSGGGMRGKGGGKGKGKGKGKDKKKD